MTPGVIRWASVLLWVTPLALGPGVEPALPTT
jgi:hypothetical protein